MPNNHVTIRPLTDPEQWNKFLLTLKPNTFLQSWQWGQIQKTSGEDVHYLGIFSGAQQIGAALVLTVNAKRGRHYFIPHGPLFANDKTTLEYLPALTQHLKQTASADNVVALRIAPLLITTPAAQRTFQQLGFRPAPMHVHAERTWVRDISGNPDKILQSMRKTTRHAIKKAHAANVTVDITTDPAALDRFYPLYESTKQRHQFVPYTHDTLTEQIAQLKTTDAVYFAIAKHRGRDVAAAILFQFGQTVFYYHGASDKLPAKVPAAQALQWAAIQEAKRRGATRYNFWGIAPADFQDKPGKPHPFAGITIFKQGFGGQAIDYLHTQDLPLTLSYWKLWLIEMWRKFRRGF